jgi:proteasome lid subunit RPN8/RPN11
MILSAEQLAAIVRHGESAYPDEGCGFVLGRFEEEARRVVEVLPLSNARSGEARHNRFLIRPTDYLLAEDTAEDHGLEIVGVFHSHPDHPAVPSQYDVDHAQPIWSYLISRFEEQQIIITRDQGEK